jgi:protease IV
MNEQTKLTEEIIDNLISDRKTDRLWRNIRFFTYIGIVLLLTLLLVVLLIPHQPSNINKKHFSLVRMSGMIMPGSNFSAARVIPELQHAFHDDKSSGVILEINSGGGAPVQSELIHNEILRLKHATKKKVIVVGDDVLASGAYLIATAADKIYVNQDTITGSIGVIMASFGFTGAMKKLHIERRVITAGKHKDRLDPFKDAEVQDTNKITNLIGITRQHFMQFVKEGRGNLLKTPAQAKINPRDNSLDTGDFWIGTEAKKLGLVDGFGDIYSVGKKEFGTQDFVDYTAKISFLDDLVGNASKSVQRAALSLTTPKVLAMSNIK